MTKKQIRKISAGWLLLSVAAILATTATAENNPSSFGKPSGSNPVAFHGWGKIRLENVTSSSDVVSDVFGNETGETTTLDHRFFLEGSTRIGEHLRVGAMLRFSSEPDDVLLNGPVYLENEWGSVFADFSNRWLDARLGYYDIFFTPLTLMRHDPSDVPENQVGGGGGNGGCNCGSTGGAFGVNLLEDIREDLTFEGGRMNMLFGDHFETTVLYARSGKPVEGESFRRHTIGARALFRYYLAHASEDMEASVQFVYHDDEEEITATAPADQSLDNRVASLYLKAPLVRNTRVFAEAARSRLEPEPIPGRFTKVDPSYGNAFTVGLAANLPGRIGVEGAWLYRGRPFDSLYSALSCMGNRQGGRFHLSWTSPESMIFMDLFGRYVEEVKAATPGDPVSFLTCSAGVAIVPFPDVSIRLSGILEEQKKDAALPINDIDARIVYGIVKTVYQVLRDNEMEIKYQYANHKDHENMFSDYETHTVTSEMRIRF